MATPISVPGFIVTNPSPHVYHVQISSGPTNEFTRELWQAYGSLFDQLSDIKDIRVVVLSSALPAYFTSGLRLSDLDFLQSPFEKDTARKGYALRDFLSKFQSAVGSPGRCYFPVIAACHGTAVGIGIDMMSACDIRYVASDVNFTIKEPDVGFAPDLGNLAYLPKITGNQSLVRELVYSSSQFGAAEAEKLGFVSKVILGGRDQVVTAALELAKVIALRSPIAVANAKYLISHSRDHSVQENLDLTAVWHGSQLLTDDIPESINANKEGRTPNFNPLPAKL